MYNINNPTFKACQLTLETKLNIIQTVVNMKLTHKEIAIKYKVKPQTVKYLMKLFRKKRSYFFEQAEKRTMKSKRVAATLAVVESMLDSDGFIGSKKLIQTQIKEKTGLHIPNESLR